MKKERLFYLDFVRAIAAISIIMTHFNARYLLYMNPPMPQKAVLTTTVSNIYIGNWGVSLFFIISGAALMYVYEEKCDLKIYFKKRFLSIYPMYWIAYICGFLYLFYMNKTVPGAGAPKINFVYSILGMDGLLAENIPTFYVLGEWFLGAIICMYLLFPLLRQGIKKKPVATWIIVLIIYIWFMFGYHYNFNVAKIIFARLPEIVFGMSFIKLRNKVDWKIAAMALIILIINEIAKPSWSENIQTTYVGILSFLVLVYLSYWIKANVVKKICNVISKYSYAIFLVHHLVIARMMSTFDLVNISVLHSYLLFCAVCAVIGFFSWALYRVHKCVIAFISETGK